MARCRSCGADVEWALTFTGKRMPVDVEPDPEHGNVEVADVGDGGPPRAFVVGPLELSVYDPADRARLRTSHFATCPDADRWRRP